MTKSTPTCLQAATPIANDERFALMFALFGRSEGDGVYGPLLLKHIRISYRLLMSSRQETHYLWEDSVEMRLRCTTQHRPHQDKDRYVLL